ncbi:MAG TPA: GPW/gp25 family protein, partial [Iamia sp.]
MTDVPLPDDDRAFLGRGWSFPPTFDRAVGGVQMLEHEADVASSLHILLSTARGERVMVPQFGCNLDELVFENLDTRMRTLMADKVEAAILYHEPRVD